MKKLLLTLFVLVGLTFTGFAQKTSTGKFSIGFEGGIPTGRQSSINSAVVGGSLKYDQLIAKSIFLTASAGYSVFTGKYVSVENIPIKTGIKYCPTDNFYLEGQLGVAITTQSVGESRFIYSPGMGFSFTPNIDLGLRYEGWDGRESLHQVAVRLAYTFN